MLAAEIARRVSQHQTESHKIIQELLTFDRHYRSEPRRRRAEIFANTFVMETFRDVESVVSALMAIMFADAPFFEIEARSLDPEAQEKAVLTQALLEHQLNVMQFHTKFTRIVRYLVLNGTAVVGTPWAFTTRFISDGDSFKEVPLIDQPDIELVALPNWRFDTFAQDVPQAEWVAVEMEASKSVLRQVISAANKLSDGEAKKPDALPAGGNQQTDIGLSVARQIRFNKGFANLDVKRNVIVDYWGKHPLKDTPVDWRIVTVNGNQTVVEIPNPYDHGMKPYLRGTYIDRDGSFYGLGVGGILRRPQEEMNDFRNLGRDILNYGLNNMQMREGVGNTKAKRLPIKPGRIFDVEEWGKLTPLPVPLESLNALIRMEELTKEDMRFASAATTTTQALPTGVTATEARIIASESGRRLNGQAISIGETLLKPFLHRMIELNKQFLENKVIVKVAGESREVGRDDLLLAPDIDIKIATDLDFRQAMQRRLTSTIQTLVQAKQVDETLEINIRPLVAKLVKTFQVDPREVISVKKPEPPPPPPEAVLPAPAAVDSGQAIIAEELARRGIPPEAAAEVLPQ
ncbi:hypothetical protein LCGC14_0800410 [marine sediment metagenome]|uniref:Uncharacterized protein n=1 Tax=marine sediment metagenome TaxID=412755 RepID=A0A0F9Q9T2_9ZZZZ